MPDETQQCCLVEPIQTYENTFNLYVQNVTEEEWTRYTPNTTGANSGFLSRRMPQARFNRFFDRLLPSYFEVNSECSISTIHDSPENARPPNFGSLVLEGVSSAVTFDGRGGTDGEASQHSGAQSFSVYILPDQSSRCQNFVITGTDDSYGPLGGSCLGTSRPPLSDAQEEHDEMKDS